jgi:hypothetical protein
MNNEEKSQELLSKLYKNLRRRNLHPIKVAMREITGRY